jgi:hypothetical protein
MFFQRRSSFVTGSSGFCPYCCLESALKPLQEPIYVFEPSFILLQLLSALRDLGSKLCFRFRVAEDFSDALERSHQIFPFLLRQTLHENLINLYSTHRLLIRFTLSISPCLKAFPSFSGLEVAEVLPDALERYHCLLRNFPSLPDHNPDIKPLPHRLLPFFTVL